MLSADGKLAFFCFLVTSVCAYLLNLQTLEYGYVHRILAHLLLFGAVNILVLIVWIVKSFKSYQIAITAAILGHIFAIGIFIWIVCEPGIRSYGLYLCSLSGFHITEFLVYSTVNPATSTVANYIIFLIKFHPPGVIASSIEFFAEWCLFPDMKKHLEWISIIAFGACIVFDVIRRTAIFTTKSNFQHEIQMEKNNERQLITHGIYKIWRHPSYVGCFYWFVATEVILLNPFSIIIISILCWRYFRSLVLREETALIKTIYGKNYYEYQKRVPTGLPFIKGYCPDAETLKKLLS